MPIIKNSLIIIPVDQSIENICDFMSQTGLILARKNNLVIYLHFSDKGKSIKEILANLFKKESLRLFYKKNNVYHFNKIELFPLKRFHFVRQINFLMNIFLLKIILKFFGQNYKKKIVWIFYPMYYYFLYVFKNYFSIYDVVDYHFSFNYSINQNYRAQENILLKKANLVTVISNSLYRIHRDKRKNIIVVPQGFVLKEFQEYKNLSIPIKLPKNKSVIGFIGAINYRLYFELLLGLVLNNPQWNFVFVGPKYFCPTEDRFVKTRRKIKKLFSLPNTFYFKAQPKKYISSIISQLDVCLIPYDTENPFNKYCHPMKVFEYFYMGKPVVSTPIEELKRLKPYVTIIKNAQEAEKAIKKILKSGWPEKYKRKQRKLAIANSWEAKIKEISRFTEATEFQLDKTK